LIAAAEAAASWARARRASWTTRPVAAAPRPAVVPPPVVAPPPIVIAPPTIAIKPAQPRASTPAPFVASETRGHEPAVEEPARAFGAVKWLVGAGVAAAVIGGAYAGWSYLSREEKPTRTAVVVPAAGKRPPATGTKGVGKLRVTTTPPAARVLVDGKARGVSPITVADLNAGSHEVELKSDAGTVRRTVTIAANETAALDESIFAGWVTVLSPFEVVITEGGRVLRSDERNQFMLAPGLHELRLSNRALSFQVAKQVEVKPGEGATVRVTPAPSTLAVTTNEAAQVWVDGTRVGETPLSGAPVQLGTHEILVKSTTGSERRYTVTIGVNPYTLKVDF
jgi:hypothetical protein